MATYVNNLRLKEIATGDESGTWGASTNTNLELLGEALGFGTEGITTNADTHATTIADGASDAGRGIYIIYTGTLDSACTITIGPNTMKRVHIIKNGTSGSQNILISQGSGANITIAAGQTKVVSLDGAGSGAAVTEVFSALSLVSPSLTGTPLAPTAGTSVNTTQIATTAYVTTAVGNAEPFPSGTSMLFQQTAAPTGWTKQTTHNDKALRLTSGTVGTGGSVAFTTAMATPAVSLGSITGTPGENLAVAAGNLAVSMSGNISATTLSVNQIPSHTHPTKAAATGGNTTTNYNLMTQGAANNTNALPPTGATGGGQSHNHGHNLSGSMSGDPAISGNITAGNLAVAASTATINVQYVDFIIANKD